MAYDAEIEGSVGILPQLRFYLMLRLSHHGSCYTMNR